MPDIINNWLQVLTVSLVIKFKAGLGHEYPAAPGASEEIVRKEPGSERLAQSMGELAKVFNSFINE